MSIIHSRSTALFAACALGLASASGAAFAAAPAGLGDREEMREDAADAIEQVNEAAAVLNQMKRDAGLAALLQDAKGVFVVPDYGRAAFGIGARGGEGVLLVNQGDGSWSRPVFYNYGGISAGLEAGVEAGSIAMVLLSDRALESFKQENNWSLNAEAGLTVINWSAKAQASVGKGDVLVWSDTEGLLGDLSVGVTDIHFDEDETAAFYGRTAPINDIIVGVVAVPHPIVGLETDD